VSQDAKTRAKIAFLSVEMDELHAATRPYWEKSTKQSKEESAKYQWRQDRLERIREELARLRN
jgi:hypothetical protein